MPPKRKYQRKAPGGLKRTVGGNQGRFKIQRGSLTRLPTIWTFRQRIADSILTQTAGAITVGVQGVQMAFLADFAHYQGLFDAYRITYLEYEFRPMYTASGTLGSALSLNPLIYTVIDKDDSTNLASVSEAQQYVNCKVHDDKRPFKVSFAPQTVSGTLEFNRKTWYDMQTGTDVYRGLKMLVTAGTAGFLQQWNLSTRVTFQCKGLR